MHLVTKPNGKLMYKNSILLACIFMIQHFTFAQVTEEDIRDRQILFYDECSFTDYETALPHLKWLLVNAPSSSENIYLKGATVLDIMIKSEQNPDRKLELQKLAISLYQQRFEVFGSNYNVKNTELTKAYQYWNKTKGQFPELMDLFKDNLELYGTYVSNANLLAYMDIVRRVKKYTNLINDQVVLEEYNRITEIIESGDVTRDKDQVLIKIDEIFVNTFPMNCDYLQEALGPNLKDDLNQVGTAKLFAKLAVKARCTDSETFDMAINQVLKYDPTPAIAMYQAKRFLANNKLEDSERLLGLALTLTEDQEVISDIYLNLAKIYTIKEDKINAKKYAFESIQINGNKKAYALSLIHI